MKAFDLKRIPAPPPPPEPKLCVACKAFRAECVAPVGESSAALCWLCAHHVVDHEVPPHLAATAECECLPHQIYPGREAPVRHAQWCTGDECTGGCVQAVRFEHGDVDYTRPVSKEELLRGSSFSDACAERMRECVKNMTPRQRELLMNGSLTMVLKPEHRHGAGYTGTISGLKPLRIWCDEPKESAPIAAVAQDADRRKPSKLPKP